MLNQVVLVGRISNEPTICESDKGEKQCIVTLAVSRPLKNEEGIYENDFIDVTLLNGIAENTVKYCKKGDIVGAKGRIQWNEGEALKIVAEKVTFLTSKKSEE